MAGGRKKAPPGDGDSGTAGQGSPVDFLARMGAKAIRNGDGSVTIPKEAVADIMEGRIRRATMTRVPGTPRFVNRDGGGVGVRKGAGRMEALSFETLRQIRERSPITQPIHSARHHQYRRMARRFNGRRGDVGWRVVHKDYYEHDADPPESIRPFIRRFERVLESPAPAYEFNTLESVMVGLGEDLLTINRPVAEVLYSALEPGRRRVVGFRPVDGALIWNTLLFAEKWKRDNPGWDRGYSPGSLTDDQALDIISEALGSDLAAFPYCAVRDGVLEQLYAPGDLLVAPVMNRTDITFAGYPPSNVEQAIEVVATFINAWDYDSSLFTKGMMAEIALGVPDMPDEEIDALVDMLREGTQGVRRAWQPPVIPMIDGKEIKAIPLKANPKDMAFEILMALCGAIATGIYRMDPSTVNLRPWDGGSGPGLNAPNRNMEIALAKEEGLQADIEHLNANILTPLARRCHPDLRVVFEYGDFDPEKEARIYEVRSRVDMTRNEIRLAQGLKPKGFWVPDDEYDSLSPEDQQRYDSNLWNMPADPSFAGQVANAQAQQQQGMGGDGWDDDEQPDDEGNGFGGPGGDPGNGFGGASQRFPFGQFQGGQMGSSGDGRPSSMSGGGRSAAAPQDSRASRPSRPMAKGRRSRYVIIEETPPRGR